MMNGSEFNQAQKLYRHAMFSEGSQGPPKGNMKFQPLIDYYHEISGVYEPNPNMIIHHRRADFGPICPCCHKPFRTPQSPRCEECGSKRLEININQPE